MLRSVPWDFWLILIVVAVVLPWRGRQRMRALMALPEVSSGDRINLYISTILFQWLLAALVAWRAFAGGITRGELGLSGGSWTLLLVTLLGAVLIAVGHWLNLRRMAGLNHPSVERLRALALRIFPRSGREIPFYILLALTAGICEEFIFRGFLIAALLRAGISTALVILLSSVLFGIAHLYQGKSGSLGTGLLGIIFAVVRITYYSLVPVVVWHAVLDVVAGIAGARFLVEKSGEAKPLLGHQ